MASRASAASWFHLSPLTLSLSLLPFRWDHILVSVVGHLREPSVQTTHQPKWKAGSGNGLVEALPLLLREAGCPCLRVLNGYKTPVPPTCESWNLPYRWQLWHHAYVNTCVCTLHTYLFSYTHTCSHTHTIYTHTLLHALTYPLIPIHTQSHTYTHSYSHSHVCNCPITCNVLSCQGLCT